MLFGQFRFLERTDRIFYFTPKDTYQKCYSHAARTHNDYVMVCVYVCVCLCVYTYICIYMHIYIYTCICNELCKNKTTF